MFFRPRQGPSPEMQRNLHEAELARQGDAGMEEQGQDMEHQGPWAKKGDPLEVPDESLRPEQAPESLETDEDLDNVVKLPPPPRMEDPTDAPDAMAAK